ncbi:MAG TPA: aminoglycoside phosphotransferase family protein [Candidatus Binatia bacterium]|nr:aminoglycoside phosphotransferase family protein [Candidatus Binatia bacterium]
MSDAHSKVTVSDPFGAGSDRQLPTITLALDPDVVNEEFHRALPRLAGDNARVSVRSITVLRHKPGRRCVIQYDVRARYDDRSRAKAIVIGKIRARRFGNEGYRLLDAIWNAGFQNDSADGVSVPEPLGVIPRLQMWLQRKVKGTIASELLPSPKGVSLARRIAEAIHKVHRADVPTDRSHTVADELAILHECLPTLCLQNPAWATRIGGILAACDKLGTRLLPSKPCGIHRDFYPAQVIVGRRRLHLIDFDLYCMGDPALDVGNFIGHITEQSLRSFGDPAALREQEQAMEERFVDLSGEVTRGAVHIYSTFTLVRHIYLSTQFAERAAFTERLMELCEHRLQLR